MPFIGRMQIPEKLRAKADKEYRTRLRQALTNPALTADQKEMLRVQLALVGKPRVYSAGSPVKTGAVRFMDPEPAISPVASVQEPTVPAVLKEVPDAKPDLDTRAPRAADLPGNNGTDSTSAKRTRGGRSRKSSS